MPQRFARADERDDTTVTLVRQIAELAYLEHGDHTTADELGWITATTFRGFRGGHHKTAVVRALG